MFNMLAGENYVKMFSAKLIKFELNEFKYSMSMMFNQNLVYVESKLPSGNCYYFHLSLTLIQTSALSTRKRYASIN